ncbi:MAG: ASCH domain-containing protein [Cyclobacteriaceae bacterium]
MKITRAISIRQPFVELIFQGKKKYEYRSTLTNIRERVYIYASLTPSAHEASWKKVKKLLGELVTGVIVGSVESVDCKWDAKVESYAYNLRGPNG